MKPKNLMHYELSIDVDHDDCGQMMFNILRESDGSRLYNLEKV